MKQRVIIEVTGTSRQRILTILEDVINEMEEFCATSSEGAYADGGSFRFVFSVPEEDTTPSHPSPHIISTEE